MERDAELQFTIDAAKSNHFMRKFSSLKHHNSVILGCHVTKSLVDTQCKVTCARLAQNFNAFKMVVFASGAHIGYVLMFVACLQKFEVEIPGRN